MSDEAVVVDTNVFGATLTTSVGNSAIVAAYGKYLSGKKLVISFQTVAELRFGALKANWGQVRRERLEDRLKMSVSIPPHDELVRAWAVLRHDCRSQGHGLGNNSHTGDLWIAATAVVLDLPLVSNDAVFKDAPGIRLLTEL